LIIAESFLLDLMPLYLLITQFMIFLLPHSQNFSFRHLPWLLLSSHSLASIGILKRCKPDRRTAGPWWKDWSTTTKTVSTQNRDRFEDQSGPSFEPTNNNNNVTVHGPKPKTQSRLRTETEGKSWPVTVHGPRPKTQSRPRTETEADRSPRLSSRNEPKTQSRLQTETEANRSLRLSSRNEPKTVSGPL